MRRPSARMATSLVLVIPLVIGRDSRLAQTSTYDDVSGVMYLAEIDRSELVEMDGSSAIRSLGIYSVALFSDTDPDIPTQTSLKWSPVPAGGIPDTLPDDSFWVHEGMAQADASGDGYGLWFVTVNAER